jgi:hypothetical protein
MKVKINNNYKCFMSTPNVNYWYDEEVHTLFIGWLWWGIDIVFKRCIIRYSRMYSWIRSDTHLPKTKRQVLLFIDEELPNGKTDDFRFRTAFLDKDDEGNPVFTTPGAQYVISDKVWWRDLTPPERAKHYAEGNSK